MNIQEESDHDIIPRDAALSPANRLVQDIILGNLTQGSLDYLGIVKRSITNSISPAIDIFDSLSETSQKQLLGFLNSYENPSAWKIIKGKSLDLYGGRYDTQDLRKLFNDLGGNLGFEIGLWRSGKNLLNISDDGKIEISSQENGESGYGIDEAKANSYKNLFSKICSLGKYFDIHYIGMRSKNLEIEKGMIVTDPFKMPFDSDYCWGIQQEARIIQEFLKDFLKKDNIGTLVTCESPISSQRRSLSYLIGGISALPTFLEVTLGTARGVVILNYIQTIDNDWIAVSSIDPNFCMKDKQPINSVCDILGGISEISLPSDILRP